MNAAQIKNWMCRRPRPDVMRVRVGDEITEIDCAGQTMIQVARSVEALQPTLIEAVNKAGKVIRAVRPADENGEAPALDSEENEPTEGGGVPRNWTQAAQAGAQFDAARMQVFAQLIADAYRHSTHVAFERLADMFEHSTRRAEAMERSLDSMHRLLLKLAQEQMEAAAEGSGDPLQAMIGAYASSAAQGAAAAAAAKTNGKPTNGANGKA